MSRRSAQEEGEEEQPGLLQALSPLSLALSTETQLSRAEPDPSPPAPPMLPAGIP